MDNTIKVVLTKEDISKLTPEYILNMFNEKTTYINDILEIIISGKSILKAQKKYTYKAKNQIKTDYLHVHLADGRHMKQYKKGWKFV